MSFEEARNSLVISFAEDSISEEEFLTLYHEYKSVNPLCPYWEFEPFCLDSLDLFLGVNPSTDKSSGQN